MARSKNSKYGGTSRAKRYSGGLVIEMRLDERQSHTYHSVVHCAPKRGRCDCKAWRGPVRLSPHDRGRLSEDSAIAFTRAAEAAVSFATYYNECLAGHMDSKPNGEPVARKLRRKGW